MISAEYLYCDERGRPRLRKLRHEPDKRFSMQAARYRNDRLYWKADPGCIERWQSDWAPRAMYNLTVLLDALKYGEPTFLVEGERDADTLVALKKLPATTNWQGASTFTVEQAEWFTRSKGSVINIVRDADPAGAYAAWTRYTALIVSGVGKRRIRLWVPPPGIKDVTDLLRAGLSGSALVREVPAAVEALASTEEAIRAARGYLSHPTDEVAS